MKWMRMGIEGNKKMKHIYVNLKRFDIPKELGGVNSLAPLKSWGETIVKNIQDDIESYQDTDFTIFFPEAHLLAAKEALKDKSRLEIGCQSVYREDTAIGGNFGAFTSNRTANAMKALGVTATIIGHCEERKDKTGVLAQAGIQNPKAVNEILNQEIISATKAGLKVLYCIGESTEEQDHWQEVLKEQLEIGLKEVNRDFVCIAYEPVWAIGPGKTPPDKDYIQMVARYIKDLTNGLDVVYGGGLKSDNAKMLASIPEVDGGLIALTRFQGEIGFYLEEYLEIVRLYLGQ